MNHIRYLLCLCVLLLGGSYQAHAQFYITGNDPASLRWRQIQTPHLQIIFPEGFEFNAQQLASTLEALCLKGSKSLSVTPKKMSIVLHNRVARSNGFVTWAPLRMELYTLPSPGQTAQDRMQSLAIHELRHMVQMDQMNREIPIILKLLFGEQAPGAIAGLLPRWYLEGDAVVTETAISSAGRGRDPFFDMPLRTQILSDSTWFHYEKATLGSYRDQVPNNYVLGYHLVSHIRQKYGLGVLSQTVGRTSRKFYQLFPFHLGLKHYTGKDSRHLMQEAIDSLRIAWRSLNNGYTASKPDLVWNAPPKVYTDYLSPHYVGPNAIIVEKEGLSDIRRFVLLDSLGNEKVLHTTGRTNADVFDYSAGKWVWTELVNDARWENQSFSVVKIGDLASGAVHTVSNHTSYYDPSLSPDGTKIVVVTASPNLDYSLNILNSLTGEILQSIPTPENAFAQCPVWDSDAQGILVVLTGNEGKSIHKLSLVSGEWSLLLPKTFVNLSGLNATSQYLFFNGVHQEVANVFALRLSDLALFRVTQAQYGAYDADFQSQQNLMVYSEYTSLGSVVAQVKTLPQMWERSELPQKVEYGFSESLALQEGWNIQSADIPQVTYPVKKFRKIPHAVNIHSWSPVCIDYHKFPSGEMGVPGLSFASQDLLETTLLSGGWQYDGSDHLFYAGLTFKGWYPVFNISMEYGGRPPYYSAWGKNSAFIKKAQRLEVKAQTYIPWIFTRNRFQTGFTPNVGINFNDGYVFSLLENKFERGQVELNYGFWFYRLLKQAPRDVAPRLGLSIFGQFTHNPFESDKFGSILSTLGKVYFPGLGHHHSLKISAGWQQQKPKKIYYSSELDFPRGYEDRLSTRLTTLSMDYAFPIAYPDWSLGFMGYIKRFSANLFFDYAWNHWKAEDSNFSLYGNYSENLRSFGADFLTDLHVMRIIFPIRTGIRASYLPIEKTFTTQWLLQIRFNQN